MYNYGLHQQINGLLRQPNIDIAGKDILFYTRFIANATAVQALYRELYGHRPDAAAHFNALLKSIIDAYTQRPDALRGRDEEKESAGHWILSNQIAGMSLYVDRFAGDLSGLKSKLDYLQDLGVNLLHLMPIFESPAGESDGGYAVSDFRKVDARFGNLQQLKELQQSMQSRGFYLMLDIVLNHTSQRHAWAQKAKQGDIAYRDYYYMFPDRQQPDRFDASMPDIFPESAPGNFTWNEECQQWVMTVFHNYQWDLNFTNPAVFVSMLDNIFFYANLGVDILRIDAPAFIWKQEGTTCQNLPQAHSLLRLIRQCVQIAAPGMALLGEAIVAPAEIMKYFGTGLYTARECDLAYNATQMALQWDALATGDTRVMLAAQHELLQKPFGTTWISYTRCHDDIGLGYDDYMIRNAGFTPYDHRRFLKDYYSGGYQGSPATGALFSVNPKTQDARISGSLASLCGLEKAIDNNDPAEIKRSVDKILLMQAHSFFIGGLPMIFYGDEAGYTNDYHYLEDPGKNYDNRWMHRPAIDWSKNARVKEDDTTEKKIFDGTRKLIGIRKQLTAIADHKNITWLTTHNHHVAGYLRSFDEQRLFCLFNFGAEAAYIGWWLFREYGPAPNHLYDHWAQKSYELGPDHESIEIAPYGFLILEAGIS